MVVHQHVDEITVERRQPLAVEQLFRRFRAEDLQALLDDVALDLIEEGGDFGKSGVARFQISELAFDRGAGDRLVELLDLLVVLSAGGGALLQGLAQYLADALGVFLDLLLLLG
ncbi:hypothetical protein D3C81_1879140 [compost metagenome]